VTAELHRVCLGVVEECGLRGATITVMTADGAEAPMAASDPDIGVMCELQFALGEGPSPDSFRVGRPVLVSDLARTDGRWLGFTPAAVAAGVGGVYAFPLGPGATRLGVLTCYTDRGRSLAQDDLARCLLAADAATRLLLSSAGEDSAEPDPEVEQSLSIRSEVYQAQGMLMVELRVSLADALARLRALAYAEGIDLNQLATDLVSGRRPLPERNDEA
jgi:hypothetical protein